MEKLVFVKPSLDLKEKILEYKNEHFEYSEYEIHGSSMLDKLEYEEWLDRIENNKDIADTFIVIRQSDNKIIGIIDIRYELYNDFLKNYAGHIGYSVRPTERRKGYNKINLYLGLLECRKQGLKNVMLDCEKNNLGSAKTIQALGGVLEREYLDDELNEMEQVYWIDVDKSIEENYEKYKSYIE